jgi:hypothetical protein
MMRDEHRRAIFKTGSASTPQSAPLDDQATGECIPYETQTHVNKLTRLLIFSVTSRRNEVMAISRLEGSAW